MRSSGARTTEIGWDACSTQALRISAPHARSVSAPPAWVAPAAALLYPYALLAFNAAVQAFEAGHARRIAAAVAALALAKAIALAATAFVCAVRWAAVSKRTVAQQRAQEVACLAVAAPPLFVLLGVLQTMAG